MNKPKILIVDDDPNILQGYRRQLRRQFQIDIADGGVEGLQAISDHGPYALVVSDMRMPKMNGVQFLAEVKKRAPDTVRIMLTGNADQQTATDAVNDGNIFRFLNKPCPAEDFSKALVAGIEQHRLITAEHEVLTKTLSGSVGLLNEMLSLVNPLAFGRSARIKRWTSRMCEAHSVPNSWEVEIAAMLSQVGCVTMPEEMLARLYSGEEISVEEMGMFQKHPETGRALVAKIPRLEGVAKIIAYQEKCFDGSGVPENDTQGEEIPLGARILKLALGLDTLLSAGESNEGAMAKIRSMHGQYDPVLIEILPTILETKFSLRTVTIEELDETMIVDEHVVTQSGDVLLASGQQVTSSMCDRLRNFSKTPQGVQEPIRVRCPLENEPAPC